MLFRGVLQACALFGAQALVRWSRGGRPEQQQSSSNGSGDAEVASSSGAAAAASITAASPLASAQAWLADPRNTIIIGGLELGAW